MSCWVRHGCWLGRHCWIGGLGYTRGREGGQGGTWLKPEPPLLPLLWDPPLPVTLPLSRAPNLHSCMYGTHTDKCLCAANRFPLSKHFRKTFWGVAMLIVVFMYKLRGKLPVKYTDVYVLPMAFRGKNFISNKIVLCNLQSKRFNYYSGSFCGKTIWCQTIYVQQ